MDSDSHPSACAFLGADIFTWNVHARRLDWLHNNYWFQCPLVTWPQYLKIDIDGSLYLQNNIGMRSAASAWELRPDPFREEGYV